MTRDHKRRSHPHGLLLLAIVVALSTACSSLSREHASIIDRALAKAEADATAEDRPSPKVRAARAAMLAEVRRLVAELAK